MTTPDLDATLAAIDAATGCQQCEGPLGNSPSGSFCSETCQLAWAASQAGTWATETMEWNHPVLGRIVEPLCDTHAKAIRAAVRELGIGCSGVRSRPGIRCHRCATLQPPREWIDQFVIDARINPKGNPMTHRSIMVKGPSKPTHKLRWWSQLWRWSR